MTDFLTHRMTQYFSQIERNSVSYLTNIVLEVTVQFICLYDIMLLYNHKNPGTKSLFLWVDQHVQLWVATLPKPQ